MEPRCIRTITANRPPDAVMAEACKHHGVVFFQHIIAKGIPGGDENHNAEWNAAWLAATNGNDKAIGRMFRGIVADLECYAVKGDMVLLDCDAAHSDITRMILDYFAGHKLALEFFRHENNKLIKLL